MKYVAIGEGTGELTEKKSRFIANAFEIHSQDEAMDIIEAQRKKYWDARHTCFAFVLGENSEVMRFSDDKEPQGTAGRPVLDVITGSDLTNILIVVNRYFGGVLLGTGGLVRAYSGAARSVISNMMQSGSIVPVISGKRISFSADYRDIGRIDSLIIQSEASVISKDYGEKAVYTIVLPSARLDGFSKDALEITNGAFTLSECSDVTYAPVPGGAVLYRF